MFNIQSVYIMQSADCGSDILMCIDTYALSLGSDEQLMLISIVFGVPVARIMVIFDY